MAVIPGTPFDDFLIGTADDDVIDAGDGNDVARGRDGNDAINGENGHDFLIGGDGNDALSGGSGDDYLRGGEGNDTIDGGAGFDRAAFTVLVNAPEIGETGVQVGATVDLNIQGVAQDTGHGMDTLIGIEHVSGTAYADTLIGNGGDNWIWGEGGADNLQGGAGNDLVETDTGNATLDGGRGDDTAGFHGSDTFTTGVIVDLALQGSAQIVAPGSTMTLTNFENLTGTTHEDSLSGDSGRNILAGNAGADYLFGASGSDTLYGDGSISVDSHETGYSGPITTYSEIPAGFALTAGNDVIDGGRGHDSLYGSGGDDLLIGGQGNDSFVIQPNSGDDSITDFTHHDTIVFDGVAGVDDFGDLTLTAAGPDTVVSWGTTDSIVLEGVAPGDIGAADFDFVGAAALTAFGRDFGPQDYWVH